MENPHFLFQLFEKNQKKKAMYASLLVHTMICWNFRFNANEYEVLRAQVANNFSKLD